MARAGTWVSYQGDAKIALAVGLVLAACLVARAGWGIQQPLRVPRVRRRGAVVPLIAGWVLALGLLIVGAALYARQTVRDFPDATAPPTPILPFTITFAIVTALLIIVGTRGSERDRIVNGILGALAAPMIFELPFDLIVMARTYPPLPPDPWLYRVEFFAPLFLVEITTISLLSLAPAVTLSRVFAQSFAVMLAVFAGWALIGFGFPSTPATFAFNVSSKLLAFVAVLGLFFPHWIDTAIGRVRRPASAPSSRA
jgi:hypothetical protein